MSKKRHGGHSPQYNRERAQRQHDFKRQDREQRVTTRKVLGELEPVPRRSIKWPKL